MKRRSLTSLCLYFMVAIGAGWIARVAPRFASGGDWPQFRGPAGDGISVETGLPIQWDATTNVRWKIPLPGTGNSSPIVARGRVFVTCGADEGRDRGLYCFDRANGRELWSRIVRVEDGEPTHETNPHCGATPATDGERVIVWHSSGGLVCYDYQGVELWRRDLGAFRHIWGYGSSPVIFGDRVYLNCGPGARTFVICIEKHSGEIVWKMDEPGGDDDEIESEGDRQMWTGSWSTPHIATIDGRQQVLVSLPQHVRAYDPANGEIQWTCEGLGPLVYTSAIVGDNVCVAMGGYGGPAIGFRPGGKGDITDSRRLWRVDQGNLQRIGSGIIVGDRLFMVNEPGIVQCLDIATGEEKWKERLSAANVWGSPVLAEGRFYVTDREGTTYVFAANPDKLDVLAENKLDGSMCNSTPALSDGQIFLRTFGHLYCIDDSNDAR